MNSADFKAQVLDLIPALRAFSRALCNDPTRADDLAQETLLKAWGARESFTVGTNLKAWLFTIARNTYYSDHRRRGREVEDPDGLRAASLPAAPEQFTEIQKRDLRRALGRLPAEQREAIMLVGAGGCSYEEASSICGCAVGTIKSRVSRARRAIMIFMEGEETSIGGGERSSQAVENAEDIEKPRRIARL